MKNLKIIFKYSINSFQQLLAKPSIIILFLISKTLRYGLFIFFLISLFRGLDSISGYSREQMVLFYVVFMFIDCLGQLLFREIYRFRQLLVSGGFDMVLVKPFPPLLRVLMGGPDIIDAIMLIPIAILMVSITYKFIQPGLPEVVGFLILLANSLLLTTAFHIFVAGIGILSLSIDHLVMVYRDVTALVRVPVDLFTDPLRSILIFVIPVGIMFTYPAKALFGLLDIKLMVVFLGIGIASLWLSSKFWNYALTKYQSASS